MKPASRSLIPTAALAAVLALAGAQPVTAQIQANPLPLPPGYTQGMATTVNSSGQVAGMVSDDTGQAGCVWTGGTPTVLPSLNVDGTVWTAAQVSAINDSGVVVGYTVLVGAENRRATGWMPNADGSYTAIDLALAGGAESEAQAINGQGQVLCRSGELWYLWENGAGTPVTATLADGTTRNISAGGSSGLGVSAFLAANGLVAGKVQVAAETYRVVLWQKTASGVTVTELTTGGMDDDACAISPNGVVAGYSWQYGLFIREPGTLSNTCLDMTPWTSGNLIYGPYWISSVNDQGQAVVVVEVSDTTNSEYKAFVPWVWQSGTWTEIPMDSLSVTGASFFWASGLINANGQVAGFAAETWQDMRGFAWSTGTGTQLLAPLSGTVSMALALNDSGLAVGFGAATVDPDLVIVPATWSLSAPASALDISAAAVSTPNPKSKTYTVTVTVTNPGATTAYDVIVTAASLGGMDSTSALPFVYGALKPGYSKQVKLQFKNVPSGSQTLTIDGTSSLGDFFTTQVVAVP